MSADLDWKPLPSHRAYLDGIRALAALWVVLSHLWISQFGLYAQPGWLGLAVNWTLYSHLAVDVFIVLSGYCLMLPVARDGELRGGMGVFYRRRARRILPPFYAALAISLLVTLILQLLARQPIRCDFHALLANAFLFQDLSPAWNVFNGPFWSIAVEWRIYFLFPVMIWMVIRWGVAPLLALAAFGGYGLTWLMLGWRPEMFQSSPWYLFLFALGLCAASSKIKYATRRGVWVLCLAGLALAGLLHFHPVTLQNGADFGRFMPVTDAAAGICMAAFLFLLSHQEKYSGVRAALAWRPLAGLGTFAYSLYLIHMPCLLLMNYLVHLVSPSLSPLARVGLLATVGLPLILAVAYFFFLAFERPFLTRHAARSSSEGSQETVCGGLAGRANIKPCK